MHRISLRAARVNAGLSQIDAAARLGISNKTLCYWESGRRFPNQPMIEALCKLYGVSYDYIDFTARA